MKEQDIKRGLFEVLAQVACSKKLTPNQKKNMLQQIKNTFRFANDQEMVDLYKSYLGAEQKCFFESKVLINVMKKLGMGKKYLMEDILT